MAQKEKEVFHVIGMSPGNSYFKDDEVRFLVESVVKRFGRVAILIADVPAISTYMAFGYPENRARRDKAIPQGNLLKNRVKRAIVQLGYSNGQVRIIDWQKEVEENKNYQESYERVKDLYVSNKKFMNSADNTTLSVLKGSKREISDLKKATKIAVHYLLSEIAFLEWASNFLNSKKVIYVYHKNWPVYEDYISGKFDGKTKEHMGFLLLENPWETYNPIWGLEDEEEKEKSPLQGVKKTGVLRVAFSNYPPALTYDHEYDNFGGIFYEVLVQIARENNWKIKWSEETGYGVVVDGLENNRFDIFGSPIWPIPERKKKANPSKPLYYSNVYIWSSKGIKEKELNNPKLRVAVKEKDISDFLSKRDFPKASQVFVPQLDTILDLLKFVSEDKADFTFAEKSLVEIFNKSNKKKLFLISEKPIEKFGNTFLFSKEGEDLKKVFNKKIDEMRKNGTIKDLIKKYSQKEDFFILN